MAPSSTTNQIPAPEFPKLTPEEIVKSAVDVVCECGGKTFTQVLLLKKISALVSPHQKATIIPLEALACFSCKKTLEITPEK